MPFWCCSDPVVLEEKKGFTVRASMNIAMKSVLLCLELKWMSEVGEGEEHEVTDEVLCDMLNLFQDNTKYLCSLCYCFLAGNKDFPSLSSGQSKHSNKCKFI